MHLQLPGERVLALDRPAIMAVLNITPDSFSDGGELLDPDAAVLAAQHALDAGADILDVGGESTRPGAARIEPGEQVRRVVPVVEALAERHPDAVISIDTTRHAVAEAALDAGAVILNDVSAGRDDDDRMFALAAERGCPLVLMHMQGAPADMQNHPTYHDVVAEVRAFLLERAADAQRAGVPHHQLILDPGIGFGKTTAHNLQLLAHLDTWVDTGHPVLLGASRKRFLGQVVGVTDPAERDIATAAVSALAVRAGVHILRVHNVAPNRQAADVTFAIMTHRNT